MAGWNLKACPARDKQVSNRRQRRQRRQRRVRVNGGDEDSRLRLRCLVVTFHLAIPANRHYDRSECPTRTRACGSQDETRRSGFWESRSSALWGSVPVATGRVCRTSWRHTPATRFGPSRYSWRSGPWSLLHVEYGSSRRVGIWHFRRLVELSQLYHAPWIDMRSATRAGRSRFRLRVRVERPRLLCVGGERRGSRQNDWSIGERIEPACSLEAGTKCSATSQPDRIPQPTSNLRRS